MPDAPQDDEDEGYASGNDKFEQAGGEFAIHIPPLGAAGAKRAWTGCLVIWLRKATRSRMKGWVFYFLEMANCEVVVRGL